MNNVSFDAFITSQVYVEGYKAYQSEKAKERLEEIIVFLALLLPLRSPGNISELSKRELNKLISTVKAQAKTKLVGMTVDIENDLKKFTSANLVVTKKLYSFLSNKSNTLRIDKTTGNLWKELSNGIIAGAGQEANKLLPSLVLAMLKDLEKTIKQGSANKLSNSDIQTSIIGTKSLNYKDGIINKVKNQLGSVINTYIQHISAFISEKVGSLVAKQYQWVSILDARTTEICTHRNGRIYNYKGGPRPPAHYNCRSTIVPVTVTLSVPNTIPSYYEWLKRQPVQIQNDILGLTRAKLLRSGKLTSKDIAYFEGARPLTLEEYKGKTNNILTQTKESA